MSTRSLPIIGTIRPTTSTSYTATEPISAAELGQVIRAPWCRQVNTSDATSAASSGGTYYALVELDGDVLVVRGEFVGGR